jgi:hypothetical protein
MIFTGCVQHSRVNDALEKSFKNIVPVDDVNHTLTLKLNPQKENALEIGSNIELVVENISDRPIIFPTGFGIEIYTIENGNWVDVENRDKILGDEISLIPGMMNFIGFEVEPMFSETKTNKFVRIVVVGEFLLDNAKTGARVAAFIDLTLRPK